MLIVYLSFSGNVDKFVSRLKVKSLRIYPSKTTISADEPFVVIVPTYDHEITHIVSDFIDYKDNVENLIGFIGSGNRNFDKDYVFNAKDLSKKYKKPLLFHFEYSGTDYDLMNFKREVLEFDFTRIKQNC